MKNIIRWFVLLLHKDMQNFEMDGATSIMIYRQIMKQTEEKIKNDTAQKRRKHDLYRSNQKSTER